MIELPPLPDYIYGAETGEYEKVLPMAEVRAYGEACARAAIEASAKACEDMQVTGSPDYYPAQAFNGACRTCAGGLRALVIAPSGPSSSQTRS
jgi:hypothetical protein